VLIPMRTVAHIITMTYGSMWPISRICSPPSVLNWSPVATLASLDVRYTDVPVIPPMTTAVEMPAAMREGNHNHDASVLIAEDVLAVVLLEEDELAGECLW
jgi:hypothetical protein